MSALTQVWVLSLVLCSTLLVTGFKLAGRLGLMIGFLLSLLFLYLILHKGLKLFLEHINTKLHQGSDPTGFSKLLQNNGPLYQFKKVYLHYTQQATTPLVWKNFKDELHVVIYKDLMEHLSESEKNSLVHIILSHGKHHGVLGRRFFSILYLALAPLSRYLNPVFSFFSSLIGMKKEIYQADLEAYKNISSPQFEHTQEFVLFLRKLHLLNFHGRPQRKGEQFFSVLSAENIKNKTLELIPSLRLRTKNIKGGL